MSSAYPKLNFPPINIRGTRHADGKTISVWSSVRGCYLVLTPEEWVRRHLVEYLISEHGLSTVDMVEEYPISVNGLSQRADLVVLKCGTPYILVECKSPEVKITVDVQRQAMRYNSVLCAEYIILSNGLTHVCLQLKDGVYTPLDCFPEM